MLFLKIIIIIVVVVIMFVSSQFALHFNHSFIHLFIYIYSFPILSPVLPSSRIRKHIFTFSVFSFFLILQCALLLLSNTLKRFVIYLIKCLNVQKHNGDEFKRIFVGLLFCFPPIITFKFLHCCHRKCIQNYVWLQIATFDKFIIHFYCKRRGKTEQIVNLLFISSQFIFRKFINKSVFLNGIKQPDRVWSA